MTQATQAPVRPSHATQAPTDEHAKTSGGNYREEDHPVRKQGKFLVGYRGVDTARRQRLTKLLRRCGIWIQPAARSDQFDALVWLYAALSQHLRHRRACGVQPADRDLSRCLQALTSVGFRSDGRIQSARRRELRARGRRSARALSRRLSLPKRTPSVARRVVTCTITRAADSSPASNRR
jgi:hypothetical protein